MDIGTSFEPARLYNMEPVNNSGNLPHSNRNGANANPGTVVQGNVSLDLYYGRSEYMSAEYESKTPDSYRSVRQELYRSFEAGLSLDFSFLGRFDGAAEKMSQLDPAVFEKWANTANDLLDLKEEDFEEFVRATDELFNEIENVLGLGPEGLDHVADFFSQQVDRFLDNVREQKAYYDTNPLGEGNDLGLGIPGMLSAAKEAIPDEFSNYVDQLKALLEDDLLDSSEHESILDLLKYISKNLNELVGEIFDGKAPPEKVHDHDDEPDEAQYATEQPAVNISQLEYAYSEQRTVSTTIALAY